MSLSDESIQKMEEVMTKKIQYSVMKIDELDAAVPMLEIEAIGAKGSSYETFLSDLTKSKDCRFGVFTYMVNRKSHPVIFYWSPHEADSLTKLCYTNVNTELKKTSFKGLPEIHASDLSKLDEDVVTTKLEEFY